MPFSNYPDDQSSLESKEAIHLEPDYLETLVENSPEAIFLTGNSGSVVYLNSEASRILGGSQGDLTGKNLGELFLNIGEAGLDNIFRSALTEKQPFQTEQYLTLNRQWYDLRVVPTKTGLAVYLHNITQHKLYDKRLEESEQHLLFLSKATSEGIVIHDKGIVIDANQAMADMLGYTMDEFIGLPLTSLIGPDSLEEVQKRMAEGYNGLYEAEGLRKDGTTFPLEGQGRFLEYRGRMVRVMAVRNIEERKAAEELLKKTQAQLVQAQRMESIGMLAGGIAHDFNNLLTAILGYSEIASMQLRTGSGEIKQELTEINKAAQRAAELTRQLLAFSRQQVLQPRVININERVREMDKLLHRLIGEDIELVSLLEPDLKQTLVDPAQFDQIILNLAVNARDAMPGGGKLIIETANVELDKTYSSQLHPEIKPGAYIVLVISDTGVGMDESTLSKIFEPFFTTKEVGKGTGLGLATVYGIVNQSNGYIYVYSEPGVGTSFKIYFPQFVPEPLNNLSLPYDSGETRHETSQDASLGGTETILVVEDDTPVRQLISKALQSYGYRPIEAANGEEAQAIIENSPGPISLILTDIIMPRLGGRELIEFLDRRNSKTKIICMSGYSDRAIGHHNTLPRCKYFLQKPFTSSNLLEKVRDTLNS